MNNTIDYILVNYANMFSPFGKSIDSSSKKLFSGVWMVSALLFVLFYRDKKGGYNSLTNQ